MRVLITGATGLLGKCLMEIVPNSYGTWYTNSSHSRPLHNLDICNRNQIQYVMNVIRPNVVIHCAGIGDVEFAEKNYVDTLEVNHKATQDLHKIAREYEAQFVYISSNAIYDGDNPPYNEKSKRHPINRYGSIKKRAENAVMAGRDWLIIRPFMLYGHPYSQGRKSWYNIIFNHLVSNKELKLVDDIYWQPTSAMNAAEVIWQLIQQSKTEQVYNIAPNEKPMTLYKFGQRIAKIGRLDGKLLSSVDSSYFTFIAPRPANTQYDVSKIKAMGIKMLKVNEGLRGLLL